MKWMGGWGWHDYCQAPQPLVEAIEELIEDASDPDGFRDVGEEPTR